METVWFFGGDERFAFAAEYLEHHGMRARNLFYRDTFIPLGEIATAAVFPIPSEKDGFLNAPLLREAISVEEAVQRSGIGRDIPVFGDKMIAERFEKGTDLSQNAALKHRNAVTTVEGLLAELATANRRALAGQSVLIFGFGALGRQAARILNGIGMRVTVAARSAKDRTEAAILGYATQTERSLNPAGFDIFLNTVPAPYINSAFLRTSEPNAILFDLASFPGGLAPEIRGRGDVRYRSLPALPGKIAPITAGEDLAKTVSELLRIP